jgi:hypothetical protein
MYEHLAESYARRLKFDVLHLVVQQDLLPFLWKGGYLGGRTFDVLMTSLPMSELQRTLDEAAKLHPESTTLGDFVRNRGCSKRKPSSAIRAKDRHTAQHKLHRYSEIGAS